MDELKLRQMLRSAAANYSDRMFKGDPFEEVIAAWNRRPEPASPAAKAVEMDANDEHREGIKALQVDAARYRWLRAGRYPIEFARSVLNDTPHGIDAAIDAAMSAQGGKQ